MSQFVKQATQALNELYDIRGKVTGLITDLSDFVLYGFIGFLINDNIEFEKAYELLVEVLNDDELCREVHALLCTITKESFETFCKDAMDIIHEESVAAEMSCIDENYAEALYNNCILAFADNIQANVVNVCSGVRQTSESVAEKLADHIEKIKKSQIKT